MLIYLFLFLNFCNAEPKHGTSVFGNLKYQSNFKNFDYVNPNAPIDGVISVGVVGSFDSFNPFIIKGTPTVASQYLFATLLSNSLDEISSSYAYVAKSVDVNNDFTIVVFEIDPNANFSNGSKITSDDVIFSFESILNNPNYKNYYSCVKNVEKLSDSKVKFYCPENKSKEIALILGQIPVLCKNAYLDGFDKNLLRIRPSSGPYQIKSFNDGRQVVLERVPNWFGNNIPSQKGLYNFKEIKFEYFRDENVLFTAFQNGSLDFLIERIAKRWATGYNFPAVINGNIKKELFPHELCEPNQGFFFNTRKTIFQNEKLREAISKIFDFEWANKNLFFGEYTRSLSYFPGCDLSATSIPKGREKEILLKFKKELPKQLFTKPFNLKSTPKEIFELLKSAGFIVKSQKMVNKNTGKPLSFSLLISKDVERIALHFKDCLKKYGIELHIQSPDSNVLMQRISDFNFDMIIAAHGQSLTPGNEQKYFVGSNAADLKGSQNFSGIKNHIVDSLIENVVSCKTHEDLKANTRALDRVLLWNYYMIPSWYLGKTRIAYKDIFSRPQTSPKFARQDPTLTWWINGSEKSKDDLPNQKEASKKTGFFEKIYVWLFS